MQQGALLQLKFGQVNCATELGCMLADAYTTDATPADEGSVLRILSLIDAFTTEGDSPDAEPPIGSATKIVSATLKWLSKVHGEGFAPAVHNAFAAYITRCLGWRGLGIATPHYALCSDVGAFVVAVAEGIKHGQAYEEDLFVTRAALSLAAARQQPGQLDGIRRAQEFLLEYEKQMDRPLDTPLINFLRMFLEVSCAPAPGPLCYPTRDSAMSTVPRV